MCPSFWQGRHNSRSEAGEHEERLSSHTVDGGRAGVDRERFRPFHAILTEAQNMKENAYIGPLRPESFACGGLQRACAGDHIISGAKWVGFPTGR